MTSGLIAGAELYFSRPRSRFAEPSAVVHRAYCARHLDACRAGKLAAVGEDDLGEIRAEIRDFRQATTAGFNALRADFVDLRQDFTDLRQVSSDLQDHVDRGFIEMRGKFDATAAGQQRIIDLIESLIDQKDR